MDPDPYFFKQNFLQCTMYNVQCTMYNVQCTMYNLQFTMYNVQYTIYNIQYIFYLYNTYLKMYLNTKLEVIFAYLSICLFV